MITQAADKALHISAYCPKECDFHILCPGLTFGHDPQAPKDGGWHIRRRIPVSVGSLGPPPDS